MLGTLKQFTDKQGLPGYEGKIVTWDFSLKVFLKSIEERPRERSPHFHVMALNPQGDMAHIGSAWKGNHVEHGDWLNLVIEVLPGLTKEPMSIMAGKNTDGTFTMRMGTPMEKDAA